MFGYDALLYFVIDCVHTICIAIYDKLVTVSGHTNKMTRMKHKEYEQIVYETVFDKVSVVVYNFAGQKVS